MESDQAAKFIAGPMHIYQHGVRGKSKVQNAHHEIFEGVSVGFIKQHIQESKEQLLGISGFVCVVFLLMCISERLICVWEMSTCSRTFLVDLQSNIFKKPRRWQLINIMADEALKRYA